MSKRTTAKSRRRHFHNILWFVCSLIVLCIVLVAINNLFSTDRYIDEWEPQRTCATSVCILQESTRAYQDDILRARVVLPQGAKTNVFTVSYEQLAYYADGTKIIPFKPYLYKLPTILSESQNFAIIIPDDAINGRYVFTITLTDQSGTAFTEIVSVTVI